MGGKMSSKKKEAASRDNPSPPPADHKILPRSSSSADDNYDILKKNNETISDIPSPADNLHCSTSSSAEKKNETIRDIPSKETLSPPDNETISDDIRRPRVGVFSDFGKQARDVLNKHYYNSYSNPKYKEFFLGLGSSSHADFLFTAYPFSDYPEVEAEGFILGECSAAAAPSNVVVNCGNSSVEIKTNPELNGFSTHIVSEIVPKALNGFISMKYPDLDGTSKAGIQCLFPPYGTFTAATFTSATLKNNLSTFHYSGTIGYGGFSMGGDFVISDPGSSYPYVDVKDYSCGIRFMNSGFDCNIGFIDKGDTLSASCVHYMKGSCAVAEFKRNLSTNENTLTIGGELQFRVTRKYDGKICQRKTTLLKSKVDNHGTMGVVLQQQLFKDTKIRICGEFNHKDLYKSPKIGLSFIL